MRRRGAGAEPEVEMSEAMRKPSESEADAKKRNSYEETLGGRPARRRAEEKDASDESTVLEYSFTVSL